MPEPPSITLSDAEGWKKTRAVPPIGAADARCSMIVSSAQSWSFGMFRSAGSKHVPYRVGGLGMVVDLGDHRMAGLVEPSWPERPL
jgi:hypothetical protein